MYENAAMKPITVSDNWEKNPNTVGNENSILVSISKYKKIKK